MENASKALIIAGAILIAILLISVAVIIINSTGSMQDRVGKSSDTMEIQTFNSNFTVYEGENVSASQVRALLSLVKSSNAANDAKTTADPKFVKLEGSTTTASSVVNTATYTVEADYGADGYVNKITINKNGTTTGTGTETGTGS